mmetsp:Transcript_1913/g.4346  ORF Transcript_1913/g.4346 Transcript_1913/m.4346 type:complete len:211 (-) Transcript_1913:246-878(-)
MDIMASTTCVRCLRTKRGSAPASSTNISSASCAAASSFPCSAPPRVCNIAGRRSWNFARSTGASSDSTKQQQARSAARRTLISPPARHCARMSCSIVRWGTRLSPMYSASCAKTLSEDSLSASAPAVTHWNKNGRSSGHLPSSKIPAASSPTVSHTLREIDLTDSSCMLFSSSPLMPSCVCAWRLAHSDTASLVRTRRSKMDAISRVSVA